MPLRFAMLASGSSGNAGWLQVGSHGLLIDAGLGPRRLAQRLSAVGAHWREVSAVLLTHTHGDHWKEKTFNHLLERYIPLYCHAYHAEYLTVVSFTFSKMEAKGLIHRYEAGQELSFGSRLRCQPLWLRHDDRATFGFRFDFNSDRDQPAQAVAYLADLGCWDHELARALQEIDLLALEFNHDVTMERNSNRSEHLIARVLGDNGHLSNEQASELLDAILRQSARKRLQHLVQLHLSRECNRTTLAVQAARVVRARHGAHFQIHTALQSQAGPHLTLHGPAHRISKPQPSMVLRPGSTIPSASPVIQPWLPGCE
jgi:ribonuclease BN (tRNA processing enzyme)